MPRPVVFPWLLSSPSRVTRGRAKALRGAPRLAPAAVRLPDWRALQLPLQFATRVPQIFVHEGARQSLERRLESGLGEPVRLAVTDNLHRMVSCRHERGVLRVRVHLMFLDAPERVQAALAGFIADSDRAASQIVGEFIEANSHRIKPVRRITQRLTTRGAVHDLASIKQRLDERYFDGATDDVLITWGRRSAPRGRARRTIKLGTYSAAERLIRVHPVLDNRWVPRYFVEYIVFHELLHHVVPVLRSAGRLTLHSPEFLRREQAFLHYQRALAWEAAHIDRLLRWR